MVVAPGARDDRAIARISAVRRVLRRSRPAADDDCAAARVLHAAAVRSDVVKGGKAFAEGLQKGLRGKLLTLGTVHDE